MNPERRRVFQDMRPAARPVVRPQGAPVPRPPAAAAPRPATPTVRRPEPSVQEKRRPGRIKYTLALTLVIILLLLTLPAWYFFKNRDDGKAASGSQQNGQTTGGTSSPDTIRMFATGDFIAHDSVNAAAKNGDSYDYLRLMSGFPAIFKQADIRFCNDPILNGGEALGIDGYPRFNSPTEFVTDMGRLGCNLVNTASNHSFDFTQDNISASVDAWESVPNMLAVAGENRNQDEHDKVHYFSVKGVKFAFLAYTTYINNDAGVTNSYGVNKFTKEFAGRQIEEAKAQGAQVIIASMRWGTEYSGDVNAQQKADAQWLSDHGVQLVLGHGPHVLQPVQQLTGSDGTKTTVWYSLGNFLNSQIPAETLFNGIAVLDFNVKTKQLTAQRYLPIYMHYEWTAAQAAAEDTNARTNLQLYLLENATQAQIDAQQLKTTAAEQKDRIASTLDAMGLKIPLIVSKDLN